MHPYLFTLPNGVIVPTWGVIIASTVLAVIYVGHRQAQRDGGYPKDMILELTIIIFAMHTVGGRIGFLRANWDEFGGDWSKIFDLTAGGSAFLESFLLIVISFAVYLRWRKIPVWNLFDLCAPLVPLGQALGRSACIFAGCCYGKPTDLPWGITFNHPESLARVYDSSTGTLGSAVGVSLHPAPVYEILYAGALFFFLSWYRPRRRFRGEVALLYLTIFPVFRFFHEFSRGDPKRGWFMEEQLGQVLSNPQGISVLMVLVMAVAWQIVPRLPGARDLRTSAAPLPDSTPEPDAG